jgi:Bacterial protein of unknown function (DUF839)
MHKLNSSRSWSGISGKTLIALAIMGSVVPAQALAQSQAQLTHVPSANPKMAGFVAPNILSTELEQIVWANGATKLENPTALIGFYGYYNDGPHMPAPGAVQVPGSIIEATKTDPDKNTYLVLRRQTGPDSNYDYGSRFLFQGHERGQQGYITRINLDADRAHRVTLMADKDIKGQPLPAFDGSTWHPWAQRLLFTAEHGKNVGVWQATATYPSVVEDISGILGRGGYEGIQADSDGNLWIVEDVGGRAGAVNKSARQANSFIYRFIPRNKHDLRAGGKLQALQVASKRHPGPIVFNPVNADEDILSQDVKDLHSYGVVFDTRWITIHDTDVDGIIPFDANAAAKMKKATPFRRPENGAFRPGTAFKEFYFTESGDKNKNTEAGADFGGFGGIFKISQKDPSSDFGRLAIFYKSDVIHTGFDNLAFWSKNKLVVVEDAGDILHTQRNELDSGYLFDINTDYAQPANRPIRILAQGRDPSATIDSALNDAGPANGFHNDGDNEITGIHISDGDPTAQGILGAKNPRPFRDGWRVFYTQQHGDNVTYEIIPARQLHTDNPPEWDGNDAE